MPETKKYRDPRKGVSECLQYLFQGKKKYDTFEVIQLNFCSQVKSLKPSFRTCTLVYAQHTEGGAGGVLRIVKVCLEKRYFLSTDPRSQELSLLFGL